MPLQRLQISQQAPYSDKSLRVTDAGRENGVSWTASKRLSRSPVLPGLAGDGGGGAAPGGVGRRAEQAVKGAWTQSTGRPAGGSAHAVIGDGVSKAIFKGAAASQRATS